MREAPLTLEDVERLEGLAHERDATRLAWNGSRQASWLYKQMMDAYLAYREEMVRHGPALLALARKALEEKHGE